MQWNLIIDNQLNLFPVAGNDSVISFDNYKEKQLIVWAESVTARPTWRLAARLSILYEIPQFENGNLIISSSFTRIFLNQYSIVPVPTLSYYSIRLQIPYWFSEMRLRIWSNSEVAGEFIHFENTSGFPVGSAVYLADDGSYQLADCRNEATSRVIGLIFQVDPGVILTDGIMYAEVDDWIIATGDPIGLNPGKVYFLRESGTLSPIPPMDEGQYVVRLGTAQSIRAMEISIEPPMRL